VALHNRLDPGRIGPALQRWLAPRLPAATAVTVSDITVPRASGFSCETVLFTADWLQDGARARRRFVARVAPEDGTGLFPHYRLDAEARIMRALAEHTPVPAPRVVGVELDPAALGGRFLLMEHVDGPIPPDDPPYSLTGWVLECSFDQQRRLIENAVSTIAAVSRVDPDRLDLRLDRHGTAAGVEYLDGLYTTGNRGLAHSVIEAGLEYLRAKAPTGERSALCWGDARIGNMIFAEDLTVAGALDWELACIGSPEADIAYFLYALRLWSQGYRAPSPPGFPDRAAILDQFTELSGHAVRHLDYYERYAAVFGAIAVLRAGHLMVDAGILPADSTMWLSNPAAAMLADYLDVPAPTEPVTGWAGHR
jgi:aminoglycoside phosphotransferase (APT) family kinase protein